MKDLAVKENGDIYLGGEGLQAQIDSDIAVADTTDFHKKNVLLAKPGDFKHAPEIGVHIRNYVNTNRTETLLRDIRRNFLKIGLNVLSLRIDEGVLTEESNYGD